MSRSLTPISELPRLLAESRGGRRRAQPGSGMNRGEEAYAQHLKLSCLAGEVAWYEFEAIKLNLSVPGETCWYKPDFLVHLPNGDLECHEVKGGKRKPNGERGYWIEEDARVKLLAAAKQYPMFRFVLAYPVGGGQWETKMIGGGA